MRIRFDEPTNVSEVTKYNKGIKPKYANKGSTLQGDMWCTCGKCIGSLLMLSNDIVVGWIDTICTCGKEIDFSEARENL